MTDEAALQAAAKIRKERIAEMRHVVKTCNCEWPLTVYRNGHGHHPDCPAVPFLVGKKTR